MHKPVYRVVACRRCGAKLGQRCSGTVRNSHSERVTDAYRMKAREAGRRAKAARRPVILDEGVLATMLANIKDLDGMEIPREQWPLAEVLVARGLITLGGARGPMDSGWRRAVAVPDFAELERRTLAAGAEREDVESMSLAELYGGISPTSLKSLKLDPPLPPPAPGVEPATAFAKRLARKLCSRWAEFDVSPGVPRPEIVVELIKAVRERDAAIVKAVKS